MSIPYNVMVINVYCVFAVHCTYGVAAHGVGSFSGFVEILLARSNRPLSANLSDKKYDKSILYLFIKTLFFCSFLTNCFV